MTKDFTEIIIKPSNNIFLELGNTNYDLEEALAELIDNSISARLSDDVNINIQFFLDKNTKKCIKLIVKDNSSGIKIKDIGSCISPAEKQTEDSLNEHGLGLKSSVASLGNLKYLKTKDKNEPPFELREFSWTIKLFDSYVDFEHGTEICIETDKRELVNIQGRKYEQNLEKLKLKLGARYRYLLSNINLNIKLEIFEDDKSLCIKRVEPIKPLYFNPWGQTNKPLIYKEKFFYGNSEAELTFGYAPKDIQEHETIGASIEDYVVKNGGSPSHPYSISVHNQGLDLIMNDRVISFHQMNEIGLHGTRHPGYNQIRGEINFKKGFKTTSTKNKMVSTEAYINVLEQIKNYLTNNPDKIGPKDKSTNLLMNNYLKGKDFQFINESDLVDKIQKNLKMPNSIYRDSEIIREYSVAEYGLKIDLLVDDIPWEVKNDLCTSHRISQLVTYMVCMGSNKGVIVASEFNDTCKKIIESYKKHNFIIDYFESKIYNI